MKVALYIFGGIFAVMGIAMFTENEAGGGIVALALGLILIVIGIRRGKGKKVKVKAQKTQPVETVKRDIGVESMKPATSGQGIERHHVAGTSYRQKEIESLGRDNPMFEMTKSELIDEGETDKEIYKLSFDVKNVELIPEPDNQYDSNAVKVVIEGVHVGYIKRGSAAHVKNLISNGKVAWIDAEIDGGPYKEIWKDDEDEYTVERGEKPYFVTVEIGCRKEAV